MTVNNKLLGVEDGSTGGNFSLEPSSSGAFWFLQKDATYAAYVLSKDINQTDDDIIATTGIPDFGDILNGAPVRRIKAKELNRVKHPSTGNTAILWMVTVETDSRIDAANQTSGDNDPTDIRPKRKWYTQKETKRVEVDINGDAIETAAGEPIIYERPVVYLVLEIQRYENYPTDPNTMYDFADHSNSSTFYGAPVGSVLLDDIQSEEEVVDGTTYIKTTYVFKFLIIIEDGSPLENTIANKRVNHKGYFYFEVGSTVAIVNLDANGHPHEANLDVDGTRLPEGDPVTFLEFPDYPYADFGTLNLEY